MANEIQRITFDCLWTDLEIGTLTLDWGGNQTNPINWDDDEAAIQSAVDATGTIGAGNTLVTKETDGITVEFINGIADYDFPEVTVYDNTLKKKADTISTVTTQSGVADISISPSNGTTVSAVAQVDEIQLISLGGATTGTFDINGNSTFATVSSLDYAGISNALATIWGGGSNTTLTDLGGGNYSVTFGGTYAATPMALMSVSNNTTDGSPDISGSVDGVAGVHQQDTCTFSGTANNGAMTFDGQSLAFNADASALSISGATASGTPMSGTITTTWNDYSSHMAVVVAANTLIDEGNPQIVTVTLPDAPDEGSLSVAIGFTGTEFNYNDSTPGSLSGFTGGGSAGNWTYTANANANDQSPSGSEGSNPLRKLAGVNVSTIQDGSSGGGDATLTPDAVAVTTAVVAPTVSPNALSITPPLVSCTVTVLSPTVIGTGATIYSPDAVTCVTAVVAPTVTTSAISITVPTVSSASAAVAPTVTKGAISITPAAVAVSTACVAPTMQRGLYPSSSFVAVTTTVVAPTVTTTPISRSPTNVIDITVLVIAPTVVGGENTVSIDDTWRRRSHRLARR